VDAPATGVDPHTATVVAIERGHADLHLTHHVKTPSDIDAGELAKGTIAQGHAGDHLKHVTPGKDDIAARVAMLQATPSVSDGAAGGAGAVSPAGGGGGECDQHTGIAAPSLAHAQVPTKVSPAALAVGAATLKHVDAPEKGVDPHLATVAAIDRGMADLHLTKHVKSPSGISAAELAKATIERGHAADGLKHVEAPETGVNPHTATVVAIERGHADLHLTHHVKAPSGISATELAKATIERGHAADGLKHVEPPKDDIKARVAMLKATPSTAGGDEAGAEGAGAGSS